jgi:hypothetical protein
MDYTVPVNYGSEQNGMDIDIPEHDDSNNYNENDYQLAEGMDQDEGEIEFSPKITLRRSTSRPQQPDAKAEEKKLAAKKSEPKKASKSKPLPQQRRPAASSALASNNAEGLRHSARRRIEPLEYWRGETYKYCRSEDLSIHFILFNRNNFLQIFLLLLMW